MRGLLQRLPLLINKLGVECQPLDWHDHVLTLASDHVTVMAHEAARTRSDELARHGPAVSAPLRQLLEQGSRIPTDDRDAALARRDRSRMLLAEVVGNGSLVIGPAALGPAPAGLATTGSPISARLATARTARGRRARCHDDHGITAWFAGHRSTGTRAGHAEPRSRTRATPLRSSAARGRGFLMIKPRPTNHHRMFLTCYEETSATAGTTSISSFTTSAAAKSTGCTGP